MTAVIPSPRTRLCEFSFKGRSIQFAWKTLMPLPGKPGQPCLIISGELSTANSSVPSGQSNLVISGVKPRIRDRRSPSSEVRVQPTPFINF